MIAGMLHFADLTFRKRKDKSTEANICRKDGTVKEVWMRDPNQYGTWLLANLLNR